MTFFDDFLELCGRDLSRERVIVFHGRSGSGKSTAIRHLVEHHFSHRFLVVIDDVVSLRQLWRLRRMLRSDATILIGTHVHPVWLRLLLFAPMIVFRTDASGLKIERHLARRGITASAAAISRFVREFGATYTDADLIVERFPSTSFDESLSRFLKFARVSSRA